MSFCRLLPILIVTSAVVGGLVAWIVGSHIWNGISLGMLIGSAPLLLLGILVSLLQFWRPDHPRCLCGQRNYEFVTMSKPKENARDTWEFQYRCIQCGQAFCSSRNAFDVMGENGVWQPYMTHSKWGRWRPADDTTSSAAR